MPGETADSDDAFSSALGEHETHLEEDLQLVSDGAGLAVGEAFRAIAALEQEPVAAGGFGELLFERLDLPTGHQGRQPGELAQDRLEHRRLGINRLLSGRLSLPGGGRPICADILVFYGF